MFGWTSVRHLSSGLWFEVRVGVGFGPGVGLVVGLGPALGLVFWPVF